MITDAMRLGVDIETLPAETRAASSVTKET